MAVELTKEARRAMIAVSRGQHSGIEFGERISRGVEKISFSRWEDVSLDQLPNLGRVAFEIPNVLFKYANSSNEKTVYVIAENAKDKNVAEPIIRFLANNVDYGAPDDSHFSYDNAQQSSRSSRVSGAAWAYRGLANFTFFTNKDMFSKVKTLLGMTSPQTGAQEHKPQY
jgi:hypothetical protein